MEQGFKDGTRGAAESNQWIEAKKKELAKVIEQYRIQWKQLRTHGKHLSILKFEKQSYQISHMREKLMEQGRIIDRLERKTADSGCMKRYMGEEKVQAIVEQVKELERIE